MQTDSQSTNIQIAKMQNADKSQNTNTHDSNAKIEAPKSKKGQFELVGNAVVGEYVWNHQDGQFSLHLPRCSSGLPNQKPQEADIAHFELNAIVCMLAIDCMVQMVHNAYVEMTTVIQYKYPSYCFGGFSSAVKVILTFIATPFK